MTRLAKMGEAGALGKRTILPLSRVIAWVTTRATLSGAVFIATAAVSVYVSVIYAPGAVGFFGAGLALVVLAIAVIDWRHFVIPDWLNAAGSILGLIQASALEPETMLHGVAIAIARGTLLALIFLAIRTGYARLRGRQGLGLGDVKLAFVAGVWLDWTMIPVAIQLAAFTALSAYIVRQLISGRSISATNRLPFGLFFAPAIWICWLIEVNWRVPF
jgi:leader peptidase (prepilin peptidase) / N-methyltransferase